MVLKLITAWLSGKVRARGAISIVVAAWVAGSAFAQPLTGPRLEAVPGRWRIPMKLMYINDHMKCSLEYRETKGGFEATTISLRASDGETPLLAWCGPSVQGLGKEAQFPRLARKSGGFNISVAPVPAAGVVLPATWKTEGEIFFDSNAAELGIGEVIAVVQPGPVDIHSLRLATHPEAPVTGIWFFNGEVTRPELPTKETLNQPGTALALIGPKGITVVSLDCHATSPELLVKPPRIIVRAGEGQRSCSWIFSVTTQGQQAFRAQWRVRLLPPGTPDEEVTRILSLDTQGGQK